MEVSGDYIVIDYPDQEESDEELYISIPYSEDYEESVSEEYDESFSEDYEESVSEDYIPVVDDFENIPDDPEIYDISEEIYSDSEIVEEPETFTESESVEEEQQTMILSTEPDEIISDISSSSSETYAEMTVESVSGNPVSIFEPDFATVLLFSVGAIGGIILGSLFWWRFRT